MCSFFINSLIAIDARISATILGAMITAIVGLVATIITQIQTKSREIEEAHRGKKVEIYQKFLGTVASLIGGQNKQSTIKQPTEQELIDFMFLHKTEILLWGSPNVIRTQLEFQKSNSPDSEYFDKFTAINNVFKAIREDIGLSNDGLNNLELIKLFLKDPDELDRESC
ncbi:hypothetical protein C7B77_18375 [Chamaesiphon polymorphus CCALA 037]|uniref:Uncharacterized protein n=1 Tax=Chamaesiphon polymorphus CCALA 037 TaxID=2107692 RepID=A0A2T1GAS8_9CYAN|nr:hypothetical protein C7B77_18375 [Chamaesiphon polymorphus CCALA 037]